MTAPRVRLGDGAVKPARQPKRMVVRPEPRPWTPAVQDWLAFLARLLAETATEGRITMAAEESAPRT